MARSRLAIVPAHVDRKILLLRGERVLLDSDLATLYEVETRLLVRAVKRNLDRFPEDFMFQLAAEEVAILRSQVGISSSSHGGRRADLARKLAALEKRYDAQFKVVFEAIRELMSPPSKPRRRIGVST